MFEKSNRTKLADDRIIGVAIPYGCIMATRLWLEPLNETRRQRSRDRGLRSTCVTAFNAMGKHK